jgi:hypothetical protein
VTTYVNQRTNQKFSKDSLARDFTKKTSNAFKMASAKLYYDDMDKQLNMPLMRQFGMMEISSGNVPMEEIKRGPKQKI